jgi:uncharacterized membrane protein HdeD (DUF308 family)
LGKKYVNQENKMNTFPIDEKALSKFGPYTLITGILLILLVTVGIFLPGIMSLSTVIFVTWLLIIGGIFWAIHTYKDSPKRVMGWLKPTLLFIPGGLMLFFPESGLAAVGLMLAIYLLMDALGSFALAQSIHPAKGWGWMAVNGVTSVLLVSYFPALGSTVYEHQSAVRWLGVGGQVSGGIFTMWRSQALRTCLRNELCSLLVPVNKLHTAVQR